MSLDTTLLEVFQVFKLEKPYRYDLEQLREWLGDMNKGKSFLHGPGEQIWAKINDSDQLTLTIRENGFSRWTAIGFLMAYDRLWGRRSKVLMSIFAIITTAKWQSAD
jgi:hypothetical protein